MKLTPDTLREFIMGNFGGVIMDNPWEKEPEFTVFRHSDNKKWFALWFHATREQLLRLGVSDATLESHEEGERIEIMNIKVDPEMVADLVREPGILPAFHMNRRYWITILLDGSVDLNFVTPLVEMSYRLTG